MVQKIKRIKGFTWIRNEVLKNAELNGSDIMVYLVLMSHADNKTFECWPGLELIAKESRLHKHTVWKSLDKLEEKKLIYRKKGRGRVNHYTILEPPKSSTKKLTGSKRAPARGPNGDLPEDQKKTSNYTKLNNTNLKKDDKISNNILHRQVMDLFNYYKDEFLVKISDTPPMFNAKQCEKLARPHIKVLGIERMKELIDVYLDSYDRFFKDNAFSLSCFLSTKIIHRLNQK